MGEEEAALGRQENDRGDGAGTDARLGVTAERGQLQAGLSDAYGHIDVATARQLMASHSGPLASLCRHPQAGAGSSTIATVILLPAERRFLFAHGQPCQSVYEMFGISSPGKGRADVSIRG